MDRELKLFLLGILGLFLVPLLICAAIEYGTVDKTTFTVLKAERVTSGESSYYLVFTDKETFCCADSMWFLKFDSSDVYGRLKVGQTYQAKVNGWRIPLFSAYRNIIEVK